jgi:hypothetical protein
MSRVLTKEEWIREGREKFGNDQMQWRFVCPVCGHVASVQDYLDAKAPEGMIAFSCIGRLLGAAREAFGGKGTGPCNYAGGGLFRLNPCIVDGVGYFEFAEASRT